MIAAITQSPAVSSWRREMLPGFYKRAIQQRNKCLWNNSINRRVILITIGEVLTATIYYSPTTTSIFVLHVWWRSLILLEINCKISSILWILSSLKLNHDNLPGVVNCQHEEEPLPHLHVLAENKRMSTR